MLYQHAQGIYLLERDEASQRKSLTRRGRLLLKKSNKLSIYLNTDIVIDLIQFT